MYKSALVVPASPYGQFADLIHKRLKIDEHAQVTREQWQTEVQKLHAHIGCHFDSEHDLRQLHGDARETGQLWVPTSSKHVCRNR